MASRTWECVVVGVVLAAAVYLLFIPPIVGVADEGDYYRLNARVGLSALPGLTFDDQYYYWLLVHWSVGPALPIFAFSTGEFPVWVARLLFTNLSKAASMDIRWVAGVHLAFLLGLILALLRACRRLPKAAYFVVAAGVVLVCTDIKYISYFNSFYGESAALLGVFAFVGAGMTATAADDLSWWHLSAIVLAAAFLTGSKAQNAVLGVFAACWTIWLFRGKPAQRYASIVAGLALVWLTGFVLARAPSPETNLYNAIYDRALPHSTDPQGAIAELGVRPESAGWIGKSYWEAKKMKIESPELFLGNATRLKLLAFYLRHPLIDLQMAREALTLSNDFRELGNFPKESGAPRLAQTQAFTGYDRLRARLASIWLVFPLLAANIAAAFIWRGRAASLISTLGIMAAVAFTIGSFYDTSTQKHLWTFNLLFDVLLFADLAAAAGRVARIRVSLPIFGYVARAFVALSLLSIPGIALRLEVFPKGLLKGASFVPNLAVTKPATQSSTLPGGTTASAGVAVDGNPNGNFFIGSVTHTNLDTNAWWQVDLGASTLIGSIVIWNRTDCCSDRLNDYWVFISDAPFNPTDTPATLENRAGTWSSHQTAVPHPSTRIAASARGRYIRVQLSGTNNLSLAEVQVFGQ